MSRTDRPAIGLAVLLFFAVVAALFVVRAIVGAGNQPLLNDTDDAMRLVVVRDLIAGQGWYEHLQHRINTPFGAELHWSRLIDLPLAGLILLLRPFAGDFAETRVLYLWPLLLLGALSWLYARLTVRLVGRDGLLPALALPAASLVTMAEFAPGRIDHHSVQILLLLVTLLCTIEALSRPRAALWAGLAAATGLAIGIESLPAIAGAVLAFGLAWVFRPDGGRAMRLFGLGFAGATLLHLCIAQPPERWFTPACDAISIVYAAAALAIGAAFTVLSCLPLRTAPARLAAGAVAGVAVLAALYLCFPGCFRGLYSDLDPWLLRNWIDRIAEAEPFLTVLLKDPVYPLAVGLPVLLAGIAIAVRLARGWHDDRAAWLVYALFLGIATALMLLQIRGARLATSLAFPAAAWAIVALRVRYLEGRRPLRLAALLGAWLGSAGLAVAILANFAIMAFPEFEKSLEDPELAARTSCRMPTSFTGLAALPPARIMAPVDLGSHLIAFTPHSVVGAPYHRNEDGARDSFRFFSGSRAEALGIAHQRGIELVVMCPALPELRGVGEVAPDALLHIVDGGALPAWLAPVDMPGTTLRVYRITGL